VGVLIICVSLIHTLGLVDDRKPLGPMLKLFIMIALAFSASHFTNTRILTLLDAHVGGPWLSTAITVLWIVTLTNAMNFLDNMDGLSGGVGAIAAASFAVVAAMHGHWFIASCFALLFGSLIGFLFHNFPPARVFMGDGGSLVIGFLLAFLAIRITYIDETSTRWHALLTPFAILAVPLYDFVSVTLVRLSKGRSPFVGDLNHFSHRIVRRGLSKRSAVLVIYGFTACTGAAGILMSSLREWQALLLAGQIMLMLVVVAIFEYAAATDASSEGGTL
jgi:UDP-GlcNAc:undecaprenyl-phosphate GlcNAc-1-phosphate transferase